MQTDCFDVLMVATLAEGSDRKQCDRLSLAQSAGPARHAKGIGGFCSVEGAISACVLDFLPVLSFVKSILKTLGVILVCLLMLCVEVSGTGCIHANC